MVTVAVLPGRSLWPGLSSSKRHRNRASILIDVRIDERQRAMKRLVGKGPRRGDDRQSLGLVHLLVRVLIGRQEFEIVFIDLRLNPNARQIRDLIQRRAFLNVLSLADIFFDHVAADRRANLHFRAGLAAAHDLVDLIFTDAEQFQPLGGAGQIQIGVRAPGIQQILLADHQFGTVEQGQVVPFVDHLAGFADVQFVDASVDASRDGAFAALVELDIADRFNLLAERLIFDLAWSARRPTPRDRARAARD